MIIAVVIIAMPIRAPFQERKLPDDSLIFTAAFCDRTPMIPLLDQLYSKKKEKKDGGKFVFIMVQTI
jgi:hypothetical protein